LIRAACVVQVQSGESLDVMRPTRSDLVVPSVICLLIFGLGVLILANPSRLIPVDVAAYQPVSGVLAIGTERGSRRIARVGFTLDGDARLFESTAIGWRGGAQDWMPGRTRLDFFVQASGPAAGDDRDPVPAMGLVVDGVRQRTLEADIGAYNYLASGRAGWVALALGGCGLTIAAFAWRRGR